MPAPRNTLSSQAAENSWYLNNLAPMRGAVERLFYYQWREPNPTKAVARHDSGLRNPDGSHRPSYDTFANRR